ncbi:MAG: hypothetical protein PVF83_15585 [Anaerolineales bacterium]|jgi:hypothetical protein
MPDETQTDRNFTQVWRDVADSINCVPEDKRKKILRNLSVFMHDMKHTLGLINNANELIRRDIHSCPEKHKSEDMISIVRTSTQQLNTYFDTMIDACCNQIDVDDE